MLQCQFISNPVKKEATSLYKEGYSTSEIYNMLEFKHNELLFTMPKLKNFFDGWCRKNKIKFAFEDIKENNSKYPNIIIEQDCEHERLFLCSEHTKMIWNQFQDIILIDSTHNVHPYFSSAIILLR